MITSRFVLAKRLFSIAVGDTYDEAALRQAREYGCLNSDDVHLLDRYLSGRQTGTDHVELQDLANRIYAFEADQ